MKTKLLFLTLLCAAFGGSLRAQSQVQSGPTNPTLCAVGAQFYNTTLSAMQVCGPTANTWGSSSSSIASGTAVMGTSAISSGACATVVTVAAAAVGTTNVIVAGFNGDPTAVTGYGASATGAVLTIYSYPTAGNVNFKVCNSSSGSITPGALTLNWKAF